MDDRKTQAILDVLADLFLTGQSGASAGGMGGKGSLAGVGGTGTNQSAKGEKAGGVQSDPLAGPEPIPIRLKPKVGSGTDGNSAARKRDWSKEQGVAAARGERADWRVEAVVLGSLPGLAGAWVSQYAEHVARGYGQVLLVRLGAQRVEIERVGAGEREVEGAADQSPESGRVWGGGAVELLDALLNEAGGKVGAVLVQVGGLEEAEELGVKRCTVLCGGYETALMEAAGLAERWVEAGGLMQVMLMGMEEGQAKAAFQRLTGMLGGRGVVLAGWRKQIAPVCGRLEGEFVVTGPVRRELMAYLRAIDRAGGPAEERAKVEREAPTAGGKEREPLQEAVQEAVAAMEAEPVCAEKRTATARGGAGVRMGRGWEYWLGQSVVPGGVVLEARCPAERGALLVLDEAGRVHVVMQERGGAAEAVLRLLRTVRWVGEHRQLLAMTQRQCRFDEQAEPAMHVVTEDVRQAMMLAGAVGQWVRVHYVQARPSQEAEAAWECLLMS